MFVAPRSVRFPLLALCLALAGCDSGGGDTSGSTGATVTVKPALGRVQYAGVRLTDLTGRELGTGQMGSGGELAVGVASGALAGGFIVELAGGPDAVYYDEGAREWRPLPAGTTLHAASADGRDQVAVTALTEIAYRRARQLAGGGALAPAHVVQANAELADWLARVPLRIESDGSPVSAGDTPDILAPTLAVDGGTVLSSGTPEGRYAILLASLAHGAHAGAVSTGDACASDASCSTLLPLIATLATDFADGVLDDRNPAGTSQGLPFVDPDVDPVDIFPDVSAPYAEDLTPQEEVGREFPGTYSLACAGETDPVTMVISDIGEITLDGPLGSYSLPFDDVTRTAPLVAHEYRLTPTGKAFRARLQHIEAGTPYNQIVTDLEIVAHASGSVTLTRAGGSTNCSTTFTHGQPAPRLPYFTEIVDGNGFVCTMAGGGPLTLGTITFGPDFFLVNGALQATRLGQVSGYRHIMYKQVTWQAVPATYEAYEWGSFDSDQFLSLSRAMLRYQGYPYMNVFDLQHAGNLQGMTNCGVGEATVDVSLLLGKEVIVLDFGDTDLML